MVTNITATALFVQRVPPIPELGLMVIQSRTAAGQVEVSVSNQNPLDAYAADRLLRIGKA